uniref:Maf family protein n=1 Tax=Brassica oleracea TaxID=3712 RepID=B2D2J7_BRAOL|nr:Maf family protein [Brassica oleracea]
MENGYKLSLGSHSMATKQILAEMGYDFTNVTADIQEKGIRKKKLEDLVLTNAEGKADEILLKLGGRNQSTQASQPSLCITADTDVV